MKTDTSEKGLETLIMRHVTGVDRLPSGAPLGVAEPAPANGGPDWIAGTSATYDREFAVDTAQLFTFLHTTQPEEYAKLGIGDYRDTKAWPARSYSPGFKARSPGAASSMCCAMASSTGR